ncbi:MAG: carboxylesterase/lipase family protein [Acidimicrobiales bacterium]
MRNMEPIVQTKCGRLRGDVGRGIVAFKGVPYAAPPVGRYRFRPPAVVEPWDGVRDATQFGPAAPQNKLVEGLGAIGLASPPGPQGDDCLSLNVWTPTLGSDRLPVLVWIHGGGFTAGSGSESCYDGATFARDGVVCVTITYRLGAAGFLHTGGAGTGNFGILDQIAALRWVQENISAFGGDPANVTIAGQSSGGGSVGALLATPAARGLFRRAIPQSGGLTTYMSLETAAEVARVFADRAGVASGDLEGFQDLATERILAVEQSIFDDAPLNANDVVGFLPLIGADVVPYAPIEAVSAGDAQGLDLLVGHTTEEFRFFMALAPSLVGGFVTDETVTAMFSLGFSDQQAEQIYRSTRPHAGPGDLISAFMTDRLFRLPAIRLADAHSSADVKADGRTYFYRVSWRSPALDGRMGAGHAVDLPYVWDTLDDPACLRLTGRNPPTELAMQMHRAWISFVSAGVPGHSGLPGWPLYSPADRLVMDFGDQPEVLADPEGAERALWIDSPV